MPNAKITVGLKTIKSGRMIYDRYFVEILVRDIETNEVLYCEPCNKSSQRVNAFDSSTLFLKMQWVVMVVGRRNIAAVVQVEHIPNESFDIYDRVVEAACEHLRIDLHIS